MAERRMLLNKNDTFVTHLRISYNTLYYNYDDVYISNDDNIKYKITGEDNNGVIQIMFKNEFILPDYFIEFFDNIENIVVQNETDNLITLNYHFITTDSSINNCEVFGKFEFKEECINSESTGCINIYGPNCIFEDNAFIKDVYNLYYYDNLTPITIIKVGYINVYTHPHVLYDLMKYNNVEEGDVKAQKYHILDNTKLYISSPTGYISKDPSVDLGNNNYIQSVNNYMYNGNYITEYGCNNNIALLRKGITLPTDATVYFPDTVTNIDYNTFEDESNLKKVVIFGRCKLTYLDGFYSSGLENIEIYSDKITDIEVSCFENSSLNIINIPKSIKHIKSCAFHHFANNSNSNFIINYKGTIEDWNDINLADDWYGDTKDIIVNCIDGTFAINPYELCRIYYKSTDYNIIDVNTQYINNELLSNTYEDKGVLVFKNAIDDINELFNDKTQLTDVWLPNYNILTTVNAFNGCIELVTVDNSKQLKYIEENTFNGCINLEVIKIDSDFILDNAFANCTSLMYVKISKRIENINMKAFADCTSLKSIYYEGTIEEWNNIDISSDWRDGSAITTIHCSDGDIQL